MMTESVIISEGGQNVQFTDREVPWMKLGKIVDGATTSADAAKAGGLDFNVSLRSCWFGETSDNEAPLGLTKLSNRKVVVRDDTSEPLGIVSSGYPVLQYREAFDFMDHNVNGAHTQYVAAGALRGGKQGFMVVRVPDIKMDVLDGKDPHEMFIVLRTSHDLTRAIEVMVMPLRGRCMNQLTLSTFSANVANRWSIRHTSTMQAKLEQASDSLQKVTLYAERFNSLAKSLMDVKINDEKAKLVLNYVIPRVGKKRDEVMGTIIEKMHSSPVVGWDGTGWGLVNAVSEYYDWGRSGGSPASRFIAALEGQTYKAINKAAVHLLRVG